MSERVVETDWMVGLGGRFVVFDGPDGSGKSTQIQAFIERVSLAGVSVRHVRDPGGTAISERVREVLLDPGLPEMDVRCELMLYMASRAQLVAEHIEPALAAGELVVADRYVSSTLAYQGTAGGLSEDEIVAVARAACGRRFPPDLTVIFDVDERTAAERLSLFGADRDRMELKSAAFHARVRAGYLEQAVRFSDRYVVIDASGEPGEVSAATLKAVRRFFVGSGDGAGAGNAGGAAEASGGGVERPPFEPDPPVSSGGVS